MKRFLTLGLCLLGMITAKNGCGEIYEISGCGIKCETNGDCPFPQKCWPDSPPCPIVPTPAPVKPNYKCGQNPSVACFGKECNNDESCPLGQYCYPGNCPNPTPFPTERGPRPTPYPTLSPLRSVSGCGYNLAYSGCGKSCSSSDECATGQLCYFSTPECPANSPLEVTESKNFDYSLIFFIFSSICFIIVSIVLYFKSRKKEFSDDQSQTKVNNPMF